jgi:hypothetical protein
MALPLLIIVVVSLFMFVVWLLYSSEQNKKATQGKIKAYILLENKILWKGLCDYSDTKVRAPWNKGGDANKKGDRTQVFTVEGESVWYDRWPDKGWFTQTIPAAFFHEREICAIFPPVPCDCGHEECQGKKVQELTPSQLGLMEDEHVTEATMKATMWVKEMFDKMGELMAKLPPAWITFVGFGLLLLALIAVGFLVYQMRGDVGWLKTYLQPPVTPGG